MPSLPTVSAAIGTWGTELNAYLTVAHDSVGGLKSVLPTFNVKDVAYGAVGNGTSDDTTAIQAALTAARTAGGGIVFCPKGTYLVTADLIVGSNTTLLGAGRGATIIKRQSTTSVAAVITNYDRTTYTDTDIVIADLTVWRDGEATTANTPFDNPIQLRGVQRVTVRGCRIRGGGKGLHLYGCQGWDVEENYFDTFVDNGFAANPITTAQTQGHGRVVNNHFATSTASGFTLGSSSCLTTQGAVLIANNNFRDCASNAIECGYNGAVPTGITIVGNVMEWNGSSTGQNSILFTDRCDDVTIMNNNIERGSIQMNTLTGTNYNNRVNISGNNVYQGSILCKQTKIGTVMGNTIRSGQLVVSSCEDVLVTTNSVSYASGNGIWCVGQGGGAVVNNRIRIIGNIVFNCTIGGSQAAFMIGGGDRIEVILNRAYDTGVGVQTYGLYIDGTTNYKDFLNDFAGNTVGERATFTSSPTRASGHGGTLGFFTATPAAQPAANPNTSGAALAALETEVNELKAALRTLGLIAT